MGTKTKKWYTVWVGPDKFWDGKRVDFSDIATKWETLEEAEHEKLECDKYLKKLIWQLQHDSIIEIMDHEEKIEIADEETSIEELRSVEEVVATLPTLEDIATYTNSMPHTAKRNAIVTEALNKIGAIHEWEGKDGIQPYDYMLDIARFGNFQLVWEYKYDNAWTYDWVEEEIRLKNMLE